MARRRRAAAAALAALLLAVLIGAQIVFSARALRGVYHETMGIAAQGAGDNASARIEFSKARAAVPFNAEYARLEATAAMRSGDPEAAVPLLNESLRLAPYAPVSMIAAAEAFLDLNRDADAEAVVGRAARVVPMEWRLYFIRGLLDLDRAQYAPAVSELKSAERIVHPQKYEVLYQLARAQYLYGEPLGASRTLMQALRLQPQALDARVLYGKSLLSLERISEAREEFAFVEQAYLKQLRAGENVERQVIEAQDLLSVSMLADQKFEEAFNKFDELYTRLTPEQIDAFAWRLSDMTWRMRDPFAPIELWARSLDLLAQTGRLYEFDASIEAIRLMCTGPEFDTLAPPRARAFTAGGNPELALEVLKAAPRELHATDTFRFARAEALAADWQNDAARSEFEALLAKPNLSPAIRKQTRTALAQIPPQ